MRFRRHPEPAEPERLTIRCERDDDRYVIAPAGELDLASAPDLERELRRIEASDVDEIVLDLGAVEFIDSIGLQPVVHAHARTERHSKRLTILPAPEPVQRCFELSGLASRLPFAERDAPARHG